VASRKAVMTQLTVHQAISAVMAELPAIGKGDKSPEGFAYRGIEAITKQLQPLLAKHQVVIVPKAEVLATVPSPAMKEGWQDVTMRVEWVIYGPDGSHIEATTNGIGRDKSDKGSNKAQTQAFKYLLLHMLCISDAKDDSDGQTYEHDRAEPASLTKDELTAKDAKGLLLEHVDGDKDAATAAWTAAGLDGRWKVTAVELALAVAAFDAISTQSAATTGERPSSSSPTPATEGEPGPEHGPGSPSGAYTQMRTKAEEYAAELPLPDEETKQ
jgi:hypothetical protein